MNEHLDLWAQVADVTELNLDNIEQVLRQIARLAVPSHPSSGKVASDEEGKRVRVNFLEPAVGGLRF